MSSGDISLKKYTEKHTEFGRQKTELRQHLDIDNTARNRLDHKFTPHARQNKNA